MIKTLINNLLNRKAETEATGIYRISKIDIHQTEVGYKCKVDDHAVEIPFSGFKAPKGMTEAQMYKTLSYIFKLVKDVEDNTEFKNEEIELVYEILPQYSFDVVGAAPLNANRISIINGQCFKETKKFFEPHQGQWFDNSVTQKQIEKIYEKLNLHMPAVIARQNHRSIV